MPWRSRIAAALAAPVQAIRKRTRSRRFFDVTIIQEQRQVKAGQWTRICTVSVGLADDHKRRHRSVEIPKPTFVISPNRMTPEALLSVAEIYRDGSELGSNAITFAVFALVHIAGEYSISPQFPDGTDYVNAIHWHCQFSDAQGKFIVMPLPAAGLRLKSISQELGHGSGNSAYRGGTAKLLLQAEDKFGNTSDDRDLQLSIPANPYVTLFSSTFSTSEECYVVVVRCDQAGAAYFQLTFLGAHHPLHVCDLNIIPAPISASKSYIHPNYLSRLREKRLEAGKKITFLLVINDIYGNPLPSNECKARLPSKISPSLLRYEHQPYMTNERVLAEKKHLTICPAQDASVCEVSFTPLITGKRTLLISVDETNTLKHAPVQQVTVDFVVKPSPSAELKLKSASPEYGHANSNSVYHVYRGATATFSLQAEDEFGNSSDDRDLQLSIPANPYVTLVSSTFSTSEECYVVVVRCDQAGAASFELTFAGVHQPLCVKNFNIIPAPISASRSYIHPDDLSRLWEEDHQIGEKIVLRFEVNDICGRPVPVNETKTRLPGKVSLKLLPCPDCGISPCNTHWYATNETMAKEEKSLNVSLLRNASACQLCLTPLIAGTRTLCIIIDESSQKMRRSVQLAVAPAPLVAIIIVTHEPSADKTEHVISYPTQERTVSVEGLNALKARVQLNPKEWSLVIMATDGTTSQESVTGVPMSDDETVVFHYTFTEEGWYDVTLKSTQGKESYVKVPLFTAEVTSPPLDPRKCSVAVLEPELSSHFDFRPLKLQLNLIDCTNQEMSFNDIDYSYLAVRVNGKAVTRFTTDSDWRGAFLKFHVGRWTGDGCKDVQVLYDDQLVGCELRVNVVGREKYRQDKYLELRTKPLEICCTGVPGGSLIGPDNANISNINRILSQKGTHHKVHCKQVSTESRGNESVVSFNLKDFDAGMAKEVLRIVSLFVESDHYRKQARTLNEGRVKWRDKATEAYNLKDYKESKRCKEMKERYSSMMDESHEKASDAIFRFFNDSRSERDIDLHGQLVGDEQKLLEYRTQLRNRKYSAVDVERMIEEKRKREDEAIRKLEQRLSPYFNQLWLEVIDGAGHHSHDHLQKIRPKVIQYVNTKGLDYVESNEGALLVTLVDYTGEEPCLANFFCKECHRTWKSSTCWKGAWQCCYSCDTEGVKSKCFPFKLRPLVEEKPRGDAGKSAVTRQDHRRLCQRCRSTGRDCSKL